MWKLIIIRVTTQKKERTGLNYILFSFTQVQNPQKWLLWKEIPFPTPKHNQALHKGMDSTMHNQKTAPDAM